MEARLYFRYRNIPDPNKLQRAPSSGSRRRVGGRHLDGRFGGHCLAVDTSLEHPQNKFGLFPDNSTLEPSEAVA